VYYHPLSFIIILCLFSCSNNTSFSPPISGEYGDHIILAYNESTKEISGIYQSQINTENESQDSCYFYFVGKFAGEKTNIISWRIGYRLKEIFGVMTMRDSLSFDLTFEKTHADCTENQGFSHVYTLKNKKTDWRYIRTIKKGGADIFTEAPNVAIIDTILQKGAIIKVTDKKIDWVKTSEGWWIREEDVIRFPG